MWEKNMPPAEMQKKIAVLRGENGLCEGMLADVMVPLRKRTALEH